MYQLVFESTPLIESLLSILRLSFKLASTTAVFSPICSVRVMLKPLTSMNNERPNPSGNVLDEQAFPPYKVQEYIANFLGRMQA